MNTRQTRDSNRFQLSKSANHKESRYNVANFNEFLDVFRESVWDIRIWPLNDSLNMRSRVVRANSLRRFETRHFSKHLRELDFKVRVSIGIPENFKHPHWASII